METETDTSEPIPADEPGSYGTDSAVTPDPQDPAVTDPTGEDDDPMDEDEPAAPRGRRIGAHGDLGPHEDVAARREQRVGACG